MKRQRAAPDRVQTGIRLEKRLVKALKAVAELHDLSLGELVEGFVYRALAGQPPFEVSALVQVRDLMGIYGLAPAAPTQEGH
jgi:hypothetical protein